MFDAGGIRIGYMLRSASMLIIGGLGGHSEFGGFVSVVSESWRMVGTELEER